jgi:F-type H+-transporting ATPase subunit epsilon
MTIYEEEGTVKKAALHAGFAEILPEKITILAEIVEWPEEIDRLRAEEARRRAEERIRIKSADIDIVRAEAALHRALTRINVLH